MRFTIIVQGTAPDSFAAHSALKFTAAAIAAGHEIYRVFFYNGGVRIADANRVPPQTDTALAPDIASQWQTLGKEHNLSLVLCIAASLQRGILNASEAQRYARPSPNLIDGFEVAGLGQLIEAGMVSDRTVTFPGSN